ncbi:MULTISPECIES: hypothetical protein [Streptomyces]|uniref:Uncharacterized protein n=1 Tax=Streptomyces fradiae ATCC 10745 = DSM 40063 TaxID=1319510 RepID=A0A1Y2P0D4_STRFR|nr:MULTISPECIES: hypothetical protein [Streptomyces]KAF0648289.1 hypothetical protein K701_18750 [Streptomyces fradiae ATCC 10745 = DSM 40063]OSY52699.1 hypothetical protein BG846_01640 [Streptomyces fradiae ATCC 10745 = DSM 40063]
MSTGRRELWVEEPVGRRRLPDPVRTAAVRAWLIAALTLIQAVVAYLFTLAGSWLAFPLVLSTIAGTVVATWSVLDVWVTRQVWKQRNGVVSEPSSTARQLRRERRMARRAAREAGRIRKQRARAARRSARRGETVPEAAPETAGDAPAQAPAGELGATGTGRQGAPAARAGRGELSRA